MPPNHTPTPAGIQPIASMSYLHLSHTRSPPSALLMLLVPIPALKLNLRPRLRWMNSLRLVVCPVLRVGGGVQSKSKT